MKKAIFVWLACLAGAMPGFAMDTCCNESCSDCFGFDSVLTFSGGGGYRQDNVKWTTFPQSAPGTVIHEKWKNLSMGIIEADAQFLACDDYLFMADFNYGWTTGSGEQGIRTINTASDALLSNIESRIKARAYDLSGAIGYQFNWCCYRYSLAPIAGYGYYFQKFVSHKYHNELGDTPPIHAHNTYRQHWSGPLLGLIVQYQITCEWQVSFMYAYHWVKFHSKVRENFPGGPIPPVGSLTGTQRTHWGHGNEFKVSTSYEFMRDWIFNINFDYKCFEGNKGKFSNHEFHSPLRSVEWVSWNVGGEVGYVF